MKYFKNKHFWQILILIILSTILYFYKLDQIPSGLYVDEATQGYNAYSILQTGKDEFGKSFPIAFRLFATYTPPLYTYLTALSINFFGLSLFGVRFVSALSGILLVITCYLFIKKQNFSNKYLPFMGAFLLAISPWEVLFARSGYEANLGLLLLVGGVYLLWKGITNNVWLFWATMILSLAIYSSFTDKFLVPLFLIGFIFLFKNKLFTKKRLKFLVLTAVLFIISQLPNLYLLTTSAFYSKTHLFYSGLVQKETNSLVFLPKFVAISIAFFNEFFSQYLTYFSPNSLFFLGDPDPQRSIPTLSVFYFWMIIPFFLGIYKLWQERAKMENKLVILLAILSPIPAALVGDPFSSYRALPLIFPLIIICVHGLDFLIQKYPKITKISLPILCLASLLLLWRGYFVLLPFERANAWDYGFDKLVKQTAMYPNEKFLLDLNNSGPIYSDMLFFTKYSPKLLQEQTDPNILNNYYNSLNFNPNKKFSNIVIRSLDYQKDIYTNQIIVEKGPVSDQTIQEHKLTKVFDIYDPQGKILFEGFRTDPIKKCEVYFNLKKLGKTERSLQCENLSHYLNLKD